MREITTVGLDLAKRVVSVCGEDELTRGRGGGYGTSLDYPVRPKKE